MDNQRINNFLHDVGESESLLINAYEAKNNKSDNRRFVNALKTGALSLAMVTGANVHSASLTDVFLQLGNKVLEQIQAPSLDNKLDQEINASAQALMQFVNRFTTEENMSKSENLHYVAKKLNELSSYTSNESYKDWYEKASSSLGKLSVLVEQQGDMNGLANSQEVNGLLAEIAGLQLSESAPNIVLLDEYDEHALRSIASQFNNNYYTAVQVAQAKEHTTTTYKDLVSNCLTHGFASSIAGQINSNPDLKANSTLSQ